MYLGVDEAGKGPVLGPMVAAAVLADPADLPADADDSKRIAPSRREAIDAAVREADGVAVGVAFVDPAEIDRPDTDMNTLTVRGQARAVRGALDAGVVAGLVDPDDTDDSDDPADPVRVVADAGDTSEARFARRLGEFVADGDTAGDDAPDHPAVDVSAAHGADEDDPVVGAASVVAKVARDERMAAIDADYPAYDAIGSGYPSDPATRDFLRAYVDDHGEVPDCARRSWATCDDVLAAAEQSGLDEF
ncbi:ribonuclease HII [Halorubrum salipaludis]|uniref:Ribonuclease n=1 Tax=Halorubrum salipaludis TaxID=2032630 RepID=A0A2A2FD11_9EURY|nr:ribonuclease HII [Halorubrum salipaludis]PAU82730.1 ribonuclease HII [Halorubrum salipaludis]